MATGDNLTWDALDALDWDTADGLAWDASFSRWYRCLFSIQQIIRNASLTGIDDANVIVRKLPWVRGADIPAVIISPINETIRWVNNNTIEVGYGCHVVIITAGNQDLTASHDAFSYLREEAIDAIVSDKVSSVDTVINTVIEPSGLILPAAFRQMYDASAFVARCISRESA